MYWAMDGLRGVTVRTVPLPTGDAGTRKTIANMQKLVVEGSRQLEVREAVIRAIRARAVAPHDYLGQVNAWFQFVRDGITFVNDPHDTEWLQTPRYTLMVRAGDCDDRAVLLAAGLRAIGIPTDFKVVAVDRRRPGSFSHVYVVANLGGNLVPLDATFPNNTLGTEPPRATRTWMVPTWPTA